MNGQKNIKLCWLYLQREFQFLRHLPNVKFNGVLKFAGAVKIQGLDTFSRSKAREGEYRVGYGGTIKLSGGRRLYVVYVYYVKGYRVSH